MLTVTLTVTKNTAGPALASLQEGLQPENLLPVLGESVMNSVRTNFQDLEDSRPNYLNAPRSHYYSAARAATSYIVEGDVAIVRIAQVGIRLRYFGGDVVHGVNPSFKTDEPTQFLTIPATAESYNHRAADFPDLKVLWGANGPYALARVTPKIMATVTEQGPQTEETEVLFWLKDEVHIQGDRTMLPSDDRLQLDLRRNFNSYVRALLDPGALDRARHRAKEKEVWAAFGGGM
jgi:hypothetical protein